MKRQRVEPVSAAGAKDLPQWEFRLAPWRWSMISDAYASKDAARVAGARDALARRFRLDPKDIEGRMIRLTSVLKYQDEGAWFDGRRVG